MSRAQSYRRCYVHGIVPSQHNCTTRPANRMRGPTAGLSSGPEWSKAQWEERDHRLFHCSHCGRRWDFSPGSTQVDCMTCDIRYVRDRVGSDWRVVERERPNASAAKPVEALEQSRHWPADIQVGDVFVNNANFAFEVTSLARSMVHYRVVGVPHGYPSEHIGYEGSAGRYWLYDFEAKLVRRATPKPGEFRKGDLVRYKGEASVWKVSGVLPCGRLDLNMVTTGCKTYATNVDPGLLELVDG